MSFPDKVWRFDLDQRIETGVGFVTLCPLLRRVSTPETQRRRLKFFTLLTIRYVG